jgi:dsDNA-specific endonuclease/ATPase MutS2
VQHKVDRFGRSYSENKGKRYYHVPDDNRSGRLASMRAQAGYAPRETFPGKREMSIYRFSEGLDSSYYEEEEEKIFKESSEVKRLIESLENSEK